MKQRLSIYLVQKGAVNNDDLIDLEKMRPPKKIDIPNTESFIFINNPPIARYPDWVDYIIYAQDKIKQEDFSKCQSESAIIVSNFAGNTFLITFGGGHHKIKKDYIERDFGLRVTLNSVDPGKLKSLDKSSYQDNPLNTRNQSSKEVDILSLNIDSEVEILSTLTGKSNVKVFGDIVTGRDSLIIITPENILSLHEILSEAMNKFRKALPKDFEWIDNINKVKDKDLCAVLDLELDDLLKDDNKVKEFWLGEPEIVDWNRQIGYVFGRYHSRSEIHSTLLFNDLKNYLKKQNQKLCCEVLRSTKISIINDHETSYDSWSAYNCFYAEVESNNELYILRNDTWYSVKKSFVERVDNELKNIGAYEYKMPTYNHFREDDYNKSISRINKTFYNLDKKLISYGGNRSRFEFADLMRNGCDLIHVKYYRSSSTLSHLFAQAFVALELFVSDEEFRKKVNNIFPTSYKIENTSLRPNSSKYTLVYAIAINREIPKKLPFFSKITLKNAAKSISMLGFTLKLAQIDIDPALEKVKRIRSSK